MLRLGISCLLALAVALIMTPVAKWLAPKVGAVDKPDARKVHSKIMPRMGGLGIFAGFMVGGIFYAGMNSQTIGLFLSTTIVFLVGIIDDMKTLSAYVKLLGQIVAALVFVAFGGYVKYLTNPFGGDLIFLDFWGIPVTIIWLVGICNAVNLIDGLDGLAGGVSTISAFTMAVVSYSSGHTLASALCLVLAFSTIGFLRYNFSPAQIFMGDSGSLTLGFVLAAISIMGFAKGATVIALIIPILILGIPIFDTFFAIVRRAAEHKPIFQPDKGHLHHRLLALGLSHKQTVVIIYAITLFMGFFAILLTLLNSWQALLIFFVVLLLLVLGARRLGILNIQSAPKEDGQKQQQKQ